jgi:hypothetical protein
MGDERSPLEWEILAEQAHALSRATERLEESLSRLKRADQATGAVDAAARDSILDEAGTRLWHLIVQREAMGITHHDILYEVLRVPPEVRNRASHRTAARLRA